MVYHFSKCPTNEYSEKDMQNKKTSDLSSHLFHFIFTTTQQTSHKRQDVKDSVWVLWRHMEVHMYSFRNVDNVQRQEAEFKPREC